MSCSKQCHNISGLAAPILVLICCYALQFALLSLKHCQIVIRHKTKKDKKSRNLSHVKTSGAVDSQKTSVTLNICHGSSVKRIILPLVPYPLGRSENQKSQ